MRIAWIGPMPNNDGGATGVGRQLLEELSKQGVRVDCYFPGDPQAVPDALRKQRNLTFYCQPTSWRWNRWYSRNNYLAFITGQVANLRCEMKLARLLAEKHRQSPYDLVYQFSHIEMHALKKHKKHLPPIVLHPSVHAAGELRWHRRENHLARVSESFKTRLLIRLLLLVRSYVQRRHIRDVDCILSLSRNFADEISRDYRLDPAKLSSIVPNPIDVDRYSPQPESGSLRTEGVVTFLFVSRIAVRKGVELMVELSHRLEDLSGKARILIVGNHSLWSDYRGLLKRMNPEVAAYLGQVPGKDMYRLYNSADALIQPSHYEPFGLTVGEALACGVPVVASDKVGAAEEVDRLCCRVFPAGDIDALEQTVRALYADLLSPKRPEISRTARAEAVRLFSNPVIVEKLRAKLQQLAGGRNDAVKQA